MQTRHRRYTGLVDEKEHLTESLKIMSHSNEDEHNYRKSGPDASDDLFTDVAKAKNDGVYFTSGSERVQAIIAVAGEDEDHGHYVGFKDLETNKVLLMVKFDCENFHGWVSNLRELDGLDENMLLTLLSDVFGPEPPTSLN